MGSRKTRGQAGIEMRNERRIWMQSAGMMLVVLMSLIAVVNAMAASSRITGKVIDQKTGVPVIGATISVDSTELGAACDLDGLYLIDAVPVGVYAITVSAIGYATTQVSGVTVSAGAPMTLDVTIAQEAAVMEGIVVEARSLKNNEGALLSQRQRAVSVSDAISAETIGRTGGGSAASALTRVTGVSVVGGKYVAVRGLMDRYTNTQLNGVLLPSADPDRQAVNLDLLPASFVDNIVVQKSFTPDKPGNFTGGSVNIGTRDYPDMRTISFSSSTAYNTQASFNDRFLTYQGGSRDWLAFDDGGRNIPALARDNGVPTDLRTVENQRLLDKVSRSYNSTMAPVIGQAPVNQSYSLSYGDLLSISDRPLGVTLGATYNRQAEYFENGEVGAWSLQNTRVGVYELTPDYFLSQVKGVDEVSWGGMGDVSYRLSSRSKLGANFLYTRDAASSASYLVGVVPRDLEADGTRLFESRTLRYTERDIMSGQFRGESMLGKDTRLDWRISAANATQADPDLRYFANTKSYLRDEETGAILDSFFDVNVNLYDAPTRLYRDMLEQSREIQQNISAPLRFGHQTGKLRLGWSFQRKTRHMRESRYTYSQGSSPLGQLGAYDGDATRFFSEGSGIVDSFYVGGQWRYQFGQYITGGFDHTNSYDGYNEILASYAMAELPVLAKLNLVGGARFEKTVMDVRSLNKNIPGQGHGYIGEKDILPSAALIYRIGESVNLRGSYGRTLARPTFREFASYASYEFINGQILLGNPNLKRTLVDNYDLRWEWFMRPGEIAAVSGFYKNFSNPIEKANVGIYDDVAYVNVNKATLYGVEFELRSRLDRLGASLTNLRLGANVTFIHSEVRIPEDDLRRRRQFIPNAPATRPLQGQSPYIVNVDLSYDNTVSGTTVTALYNVFGERIDQIGDVHEDVVELPRHQVDLIGSQKLLGSLFIKGGVRNTLNEGVRKVIQHTVTATGETQEGVREAYTIGRTFNLGLSYSFH